MSPQTFMISSRQDMPINHSSTKRKRTSVLQRQQCGYLWGYFSVAKRTPLAVRVSRMKSVVAVSEAFFPSRMPNPGRKQPNSSKGAIPGSFSLTQ